MRLRAFALMGVFMAGLVGTVGPGQASHDDGTPLVREGGGPGAGWVAFNFTTDGAKVVVDVVAINSTDFTQGAAFVYDAEGRSRGAFVFTILGSEGGGILVDVEPVPGVGFNVSTYGEGRACCSAGMGLSINGDDPAEPTRGDFKVVLYVAGDMERWGWTFRAEEGAVLHGVEWGAETFLYASKDFRGVANVRAAHLTGARVQVETALELDVGSRLVGIYMHVLSSVDRMTILTPDGQTQECACFFYDMIGADALGPGGYTFGLTGIGGGLAGLDEVVLGGADVRLA